MEDRLLLWRFKQGSAEALKRIYIKYSRDMFTLATAMVRQSSTAEDIVHDVIVKFAQSGRTIKINGNLKSFLMTSVANRARDIMRRHARNDAMLCTKANEFKELAQVTFKDERLDQLTQSLGQLPYEQQEVILLHVRGGLRFKDIALCQGVTNDTVRSRYRYGLQKLRSLMENEVSK